MRTERIHPANKRMMVVRLVGNIELKVGDGSTHVFAPGSVHFLEDTTGEGHSGRLLSEDNMSLMLELEE